MSSETALPCAVVLPAERPTKFTPERIQQIDALELKILQSYVFVLRMDKNEQGYRASTLERHGAYEVRLIDSPEMAQWGTVPFWIELFDHNTNAAVDSFGGYNLEAVAIAADAFITRAKVGKP